MLNSLRSAASTWVAAVFIGLLVLSFAVWGIEDLFRARQDTAVVKIGKLEIGQEQYRDLVQRRISETSRQIGRQLSFQEAQILGLEGRVLSELLVDVTLNEDALQQQLAITDEALGQVIVSDPLFAGPNGQFNRNAYTNFIRQNYGSEAAYLAERRRELFRAQIYNSLVDGVKMPAIQLDLVNRFENETRTIDYITLDNSKVDPAGLPTVDELNTYFSSVASRYRAPEVRQISVLSLDENDAKARIEVNEDDTKTYYQNNLSAFSTPEQRTVLQIKVQDDAAAQEIADTLASGMSFEEVAKERGLAQSDISLGTVTPKDILDPIESEAVFALEKDVVSEPVKGRFGTAFFKVTEILPGTQKTYEDVKDTIIEEIKTSQANVEMLDIFDEVEDLRAGGATFEEIRDKLGLTLQGFETTQTSTTVTGEPLEIPNAARVLGAAFEADPADEIDALDAPSGFTWVHVDSITEARPRELEEVRDQVVADWKQEQTRLALNAKAADIVSRLEAGETLQSIAAELELPLQTAANVKRTEQSFEVADTALAIIFNTLKGAYSQAPGYQDATRIVFTVRGVNLAQPELAAEAKSTLQERLAEDLMIQYVAERQEELGLVLNDTNRLRALGQLPPAQ